jgi:hypothetical protein
MASSSAAARAANFAALTENRRALIGAMRGRSVDAYVARHEAVRPSPKGPKR